MRFFLLAINKACLFIFAMGLLAINAAQPVLAATGPPSSTSSNNPIQQQIISATGTNTLLAMGQDCHDVKTQTQQYYKCQAYQQILNKWLGCDQHMFYQANDSRDSTVQINQWYTKPIAFSSCYNSAKSKLSTISSSKCSSMVRDSRPNTAWSTCTDIEESLHDAIGCDKNFFQPNGNGTWTQNTDNINVCKQTISEISKLSLLTSTGTSSKTVGQTAATTSSSNSDSQLGCEAQLNNPLSWIICPVVNSLVSFVATIDGFITDQLKVDTNRIFCDQAGSSCEDYFNAWKNFRNIALGLIVIVGLIIVISQAVGMEILDAYTIRRTLPRLLIAAIGVTLSWPLMQFFITLTNDLGYGVRALILAPFNNSGSDIDLTVLGGGVWQFFGAPVATGAVALAAFPAWVLLGGPAALFAWAGTAALAAFIAFVVLVIRQVAIIMMVLIAPMAIIMYILPNTQKYYKLWWESFSKALLMFPLISAFIATGRVFSAIAIKSGGDSSHVVNQIVGFIAYFAPYLLIPLTFKMAGSFVGQLGGLVSDRSQGAFGALREVRKKQRASRLERARGAGLYRKKTGLTGFLNKVGFYTLDADEQLPYDLGAGKGVAGGKYNPLRGIGGVMFGRTASNMSALKAAAKKEHVTKAVQQAALDKSTGYALLGMREKLKGGMTKGGLEYMDTHYGVKDESGKVTSWRLPENADYRGLVQYAQDLRSGSMAGSHAAFAAYELLDQEKAGLLTSFGGTMETQRADIESIAAVSLAGAGKLSQSDGTAIFQRQKGTKQDPAQEAMAGAVLQLMEEAATAKRQDWRRTKGIRADAQGNMFPVFSDQRVVTKEGQPAIPAYQTDEALDALKTAPISAIAAGKAGDYFKETIDAYRFWCNDSVDGKLTQDAKQLRDSLMYQVGQWGQADPGAKSYLIQQLESIGISQTELDNYTRRGTPDIHALGLDGAPTPPPEPPAGH